MEVMGLKAPQRARAADLGEVVLEITTKVLDGRPAVAVVIQEVRLPIKPLELEAVVRLMPGPTRLHKVMPTRVTER
jgi:hypothetical protein